MKKIKWSIFFESIYWSIGIIIYSILSAEKDGERCSYTCWMLLCFGLFQALRGLNGRWNN
jgi:hypothetical protein